MGQFYSDRWNWVGYQILYRPEMRVNGQRTFWTAHHMLSSAWLLPWKAPGRYLLEPSQGLHQPTEATWWLSVNMKALSRRAFVWLHKGKLNPKGSDYNNPLRDEIQACIFPFSNFNCRTQESVFFTSWSVSKEPRLGQGHFYKSLWLSIWLK